MLGNNYYLEWDMQAEVRRRQAEAANERRVRMLQRAARCARAPRVLRLGRLTLAWKT